VPIGETATVAVNLVLRDGLTPGLAKSEEELAAFNAQAKTSGTAMGAAASGMERASTKAISLGGALGHAKGQLAGLLTGPLGMIGLGAGAFAVGKFFDDSIKSVYDLGNASIKLQRIIGGTVAQASQVLAVGEKYGVTYDQLTRSAAFYEKAVGKLASTQASASKVQASAATQALEAEKLHAEALGQTTKALDKLIKEQKARDALAAGTVGNLSKLQQFDAKWGVQLETSKGRTVSFTDALDQLSKAYVKASDKGLFAAETAQLFGKQYAALLPIMAAVGKDGLAKAQQEAVDLGVTLTDKTAKDLVAARDASIAFNEQMMRLKLAIGTQVVPVLTDLQRGITDFLQHGGAQQIAQTFGSILSVGRQVADSVGQVVGGLAKAWGMLPGPLQQILVTGFVANKVIKWTFGFSGLDLLKNVLGMGAGGGILGRIPINGSLLGGRGSSPANPVYVAGVGAGGIPGLGGAAAGAGGLTVGGVVTAAALGLGVAAAWKILVQDPSLDAQQRGVAASAQKQLATGNMADIATGLRAIKQGITDIQNLPGGTTLYKGQFDFLMNLQKLYEARIKELTIHGPAATPKVLGDPTGGQNRGQTVHPLTKQDVQDATTKAAVQGNRDLAKTRDLNDAKLSIGMAVRDAKTTLQRSELQVGTTVRGGVTVMTDVLVGVLNGGFGSVVGAISALSGLPAFLSPANVNRKLPGRGGVPSRSTDITSVPSSGEGQNRGRTIHPIILNASVSARSIDSATATARAYGTSATRAGAAGVLIRG
jgi:hypothetical protein